MATARGVGGRAALAWTWRGRSSPTLGPPIVLLSGLYALALALGIATLLTPPRLVLVLGTSGTGAVRVAWDQPASNLWDRGVRWGDQVLALDGRPPTQRDAGLWVGDQVAVRGLTGRVTRVSALDLQAGRDPLPLLVLSPWFFLLGLLVVLRAPYPHVGRAAYALFGSAACALALAPAADADQVVAGVVEFAVVLLFAAAFLRFFLTFPRLRGARGWRWVLVAPLTVIALDLAGLIWPALAASAYRLRLLVLLVYLLLGAGVLVDELIRQRARDLRRGLAIMGAGTVVSILPFATLYLVPLLLHRPVRASAEHAALGLVLLPASFAYAILHHNVLDMRLLQRWLVYVLLWVLLFAPCVVVAAVLYDRSSGGPPGTGRTIAAATLLALLTTVVFGPLHGRLRRRADRLLFKDSYDYRASLQGLSRELSLAGDPATLGTEVLDTLRRLMNLDFAALLVWDGAALGVRAATGAYQPALLTALVMAAEDVGDVPRVVPLASSEGGLTVLVLLVPLRTRGDVVGHLCLGPKATGEPFRAEDHDLLGTLSGHLAALVRNAHLVGDLSAQVGALDALNERLQRAQEEEWARLAADLHDEPLQTALALQRRLVTIAGAEGGGGVAVPVALGQRLIVELRALCTSARPPVLDDLGLLAALDLLAQERGAEAGIAIALDADPVLAGRALTPATQLVLYRATQESLNNCLRHAHPRAIEIAVWRHGAMACLRVSDDGAGFTPPARLDALAAQGHRGLAGLQARVRRAGGRLDIASAPGRGTVVRVELPLAGGTP